MVYSRDEEMRERLAQRLVEMLSASPLSEQNGQMFAVESLLENNGFPVGEPSRKNPRAFARDLFLSGALATLVEMALEADYSPETAESPEDMILRLVPSDGHLE